MESANGVEVLCGSEETAMSRAAERLAAAAEMLEQAVERMKQREGSFAIEAEASIERIVATVESRRELELEQRLVAAETELSVLRAKSATADVERGRKTLPAGMVNLLAKQGVGG